MSKIEVNTVEPQCGTTLTLGGCGQTVALGSGASQTGFGRTGTVDWITTPKVTGDSPVTAVTGKGYFLNTTAGTITINLPAGAAGSIVSMADYAATWQTNNVTVAANGSEKIGGDTNDATLSTEGQSVTFVYVDAVQGWVNTMDSTSNVRGISFVAATVSGACNTLVTAPCCANVKIATFTGPGTFCVSSVNPCAANNLVSYMVVAGGGGGGGLGGGGGGGGFREYKSPVTPYTASPLDGNPGGTAITVSATPYAITVGGGGSGGLCGGSGGPSTQGLTSIFSTITSAGGGTGGSHACGYVNGGCGGSGGGGAITGSGGSAGSGNTPSTIPAQGNNGGTTHNAPTETGGGGGGAGAVGANAGGGCGGNGGAGVATSITASPVTRAGGGGGGTRTDQGYPGATAGAGGTGGGGAGTNTVNTAGVGLDNTGGGGGGSGYSNPPNCIANSNGGNGGSGIIVIRYKFQ